MQYISYMEKDKPETGIKIEYNGELDIKLIAALHFLVSRGGIDFSLSAIIDAIQGVIELDKILTIFDDRCIIVKDEVQDILSKKIVTAADLFS